MPEFVRRRLVKLRATLADKALDAVLVSHPQNRRYLSGFTGSDGFLLVTQEKALLATDFRYHEQARREAPDFELLALGSYAPGWLVDAANRVGAARAAFEAAHTTFQEYRQFVQAIEQAGSTVQLVPHTTIVERQRAIKEDEELASISAAAGLASAAVEHLRSVARPGMSEKALAWEVESFLRANGSGPVPFEVIVASGPNAALPHARPTERVVQAGEPVVVDLGARVDGYCCDMTRTLCLGDCDQTFRRIYDIVLAAQQTALALMQPGMTGAEIDKLARTVIEQAGYGDRFGHGLGHGVGLETHESPRLGPTSDDVITDGMVFTVEPGVYVSGWGGVRIEDTVVLEGKARVLK